MLKLILFVIVLTELVNPVYSDTDREKNTKLSNSEVQNKPMKESLTENIESLTINKKSSTGKKQPAQGIAPYRPLEFVPSEKINADSSVPFPVDI